jgi:hypothetical protein
VPREPAARWRSITGAATKATAAAVSNSQPTGPAATNTTLATSSTSTEAPTVEARLARATAANPRTAKNSPSAIGRKRE